MNNADIINQFMRFQQSFQGDPKAEVMKLLQSGRITQSQLDQVQALAKQLQTLLKR